MSGLLSKPVVLGAAAAVAAVSVLLLLRRGRGKRGGVHAKPGPETFAKYALSDKLYCYANSEAQIRLSDTGVGAAAPETVRNVIYIDC